MRFRVDRVQTRASRRVPEANGTISRAAAARQQILLPRTPRNAFHRRLMVRERVSWRAGAVRVPDAEQVVVAARGELAFAAVRQATHLLCVFGERGCHV